MLHALKTSILRLGPSLLAQVLHILNAMTLYRRLSRFQPLGVSLLRPVARFFIIFYLLHYVFRVPIAVRMFKKDESVY